MRAVAADDGETIKTLYRTGDDQVLETVLMLYPNRATVCVSCQVGCAVGCAFCATGLMGLSRNLGAGEMVAQVVGAAREARQRGRELTNIVMMGMGEPLQNYAEMMKFINIVHDPQGLDIGARRITVSTSGIVPKIDALAEEPLQLNLAISLHAPDDELRSQLVPINRRYPIATLMAAVDRYIARTGRRVSFEYALMRGVNDGRPDGAPSWPRCCVVDSATSTSSRSTPSSVLPYERPDPAGIERFAGILRAAGIPTSVRYSRGLDIDAACGQLRAKELDPVSGVPFVRRDRYPVPVRCRRPDRNRWTARNGQLMPAPEFLAQPRAALASRSTSLGDAGWGARLALDSESMEP